MGLTGRSIGVNESICQLAKKIMYQLVVSLEQ